MVSSIIGFGAVAVDGCVDLNDSALFESLNVSNGATRIVDSSNIQKVTVALKKEGHNITYCPAGSIGNVMDCLALNGAPTAIVGLYGDDAMGKIASQRARDVITKLILDPIPGATTSSLLAVSHVERGALERSFLIDLGISEAIQSSHITPTIFGTNNVVIIEGYGFAGIKNGPDIIGHVVNTAGNSGASVILTLSATHILNGFSGEINKLIESGKIDMVTGNLDEFLLLTGQNNLHGIEDKLKKQNINYLITLGEAGAVASVKGNRSSIRALPANIINVNGAGDGFLAAFIYELNETTIISAETIPRALARGAQMAKLIIESETPRLTNYGFADLSSL